jgi:transposase
MGIFTHHAEDLQTFRMIASQLYVNGNATQSEICRTFGVTDISVKRWVKLYREKGSAGFYEKRRTRGAAVLTEDVVATAQRLLDEGLELATVAERLGVKKDTMQKAIAAGRLHVVKKTL